MDLSFSEEQLALREVVHKFLDEVSTEEAVRELMADERGFGWCGALAPTTQHLAPTAIRP